MRLTYSDHLKYRLSLRNIEYSLPERIFHDSVETYFDEETGHLIATIEIELYNKKREVMVAYAIQEETVTLLTIHPLKPGQKDNRVKSGRWRRI